MTIESRLDEIVRLLGVIADRVGGRTTEPVKTALEALASAETPGAVRRLAEAAKAEAEKQDAAAKVPYKPSVADELAAGNAAVAKTLPPAKPAKVSKEALADAVRAAAAIHGGDKVKTVVEGFGVQRASLAPEEKWPEIVAAVQAIKGDTTEKA